MQKLFIQLNEELLVFNSSGLSSTNCKAYSSNKKTANQVFDSRFLLFYLYIFV